MGGRHAEGRNLLSGETIPLPNPGSFKPQIARFQESRQLEQPGYAKMQPGFMKNRCHRLTFNVGEYPVIPPPGMGRLGRPIGSPNGVREGQMKRSPVLGVRVSPTGGAREDAPASSGGMRAAGAVRGQSIGAFFVALKSARVFWRRNSAASGMREGPEKGGAVFGVRVSPGGGAWLDTPASAVGDMRVAGVWHVGDFPSRCNLLRFGEAGHAGG